MEESKLLLRIRVARRDLANLLFHFTEGRYFSGRIEATKRNSSCRLRSVYMDKNGLDYNMPKYLILVKPTDGFEPPTR